MGHLGKEVPKLEVVLYPKKKKKVSNKTDRSQGHVQKGLQECLYIKCCGIFWFLVSYSISFFNYKTQENTKEDPDNPEPAE